MKKNETFGPDDKPEITYPCLWQYKVIGKDQDLLEAAIKEICAPNPVSISFSNTSSSGKYYSLNAELEVENEEQRNSLFTAFKNHPAVTMVI